MGATGEENVHC